MTRLPCPSRSGAGLLAILAGIAAVACLGPDADSDRCQQTYEFGNTGCAVIEGRVYDGQGGLTAPAGRSDSVLLVQARSLTPFDGELEATDRLRGTPDFSLRLIRWNARPLSQPDTATVQIVAQLLSSTPFALLAVDSATIRVTLAPVGQRFQRFAIDLHLRSVER